MIGKSFPGAPLLVSGAFFVLEGCAGRARVSGSAEAVGGPRAAALPTTVIEGVPFLYQSDETCGPSSLAMVLRFLGQDISATEILHDTATPGLEGTLITDLAAAARRRGFTAEIVELDSTRLRQRISEGIPVVLLVDLGIWVWSRPHYLVAYGWTPEGVVAHSGRERGKVIPWPTLDSEWEKMNRLALIVRRAP